VTLFPERSQDRRPHPAASSHRILVVEDNLDSVRSLVLLLREQGHTVEYAINGYAAIAAAQAFKPGMVLLDIGLPGLDGFEVCKRIKRLPGMEKVRVFSVTAYSQDEYRQKALAAGCERHFVKPVSHREWTELLEHA